MKILLLGATGRTGRQILEQALERAHSVSALVRNKQKLTINHPQLLLLEGDPLDKMALSRALQDCEAVVSALNISRTSDFPWAPLRTPKDFLSKVMTNIIEMLGPSSSVRIIFISAWGVAETKKDIPGWFRWFIDHSNLRYPYLDHERQENLLKQTSLQWTSVRPAGLTNGKKKKEVIASFNNQPKPNLLISRKNLAGFMLDVLEKNLYIREMPVVSQLK
jgi:putative NADH-flavin reductase